MVQFFPSIIALNKEPVKLFRPPYWNDSPNMYEAIEELALEGFDFFIVWGASGFRDLGAKSSEWKKVATETVDYLKKWNTKEKPDRKDKPAIICYHEYHDAIWGHMKDIVKYLQDGGFVLETFRKDYCVEDKEYYPQPGLLDRLF